MGKSGNSQPKREKLQIGCRLIETKESKYYPLTLSAPKPQQTGYQFSRLVRLEMTLENLSWAIPVTFPAKMS